MIPRNAGVGVSRLDGSTAARSIPETTTVLSWPLHLVPPGSGHGAHKLPGAGPYDRASESPPDVDTKHVVVLADFTQVLQDAADTEDDLHRPDLDRLRSGNAPAKQERMALDRSHPWIHGLPS